MSASLIAAAVLAGFGYMLSVHAHPYTRCHSCQGIGWHRGLVYGYASRACARCGGNGMQLPLQLRLGARFFLSGTGRK